MSNPRSIGAIVVFLAVGALQPVVAQRIPRAGVQDRFWDAAISGDTTTLKAALDSGAVIDSLDVRTSANGRRALNWAAINDHVDVLRILLARGASIEAKNRTFNTPLHHAAEVGALASTRFLLISGADPGAVNLNGDRPSDVARRNGYLEVTAMLEKAERGERPRPQ